MMMKKRLVAAAVVSCIAAPMAAQAVNLSANDAGEVLLYPYYNVNEGNTTFVSVTNTTNVVKAVKVRFREGVGSEDVFDFTLYLSPQDVWVGALSQRDGAVKLSVPSDNSCTVPGKAQLEAASFSDARIDPTYSKDVLSRLSEGHIEIIEMAELPYTAGASDIADAVTHDANGMPVDCTVPTTFTGAQLPAILDNAVVTAGGVTQDFQAPAGGLFGNAAIFNSNSGIYFPYNAQALENFAPGGPIWWPQNSRPFENVQAGAAPGQDSAGNPIDNYRTADTGSTIPGGANTLNFDLPDLSTPSTAEVGGNVAVGVFQNGPALLADNFAAPSPNANVSKANAVTAALIGSTLQGEFLTSQTFATDWLITFPTRYLLVSDTGFRAPFTTAEDPVSGQACHDVTFDYWNREEAKNAIDPGVGVSPGLPAPAFSLCYEVNVLALNASSEYSPSLGSKAVKADAPLEFEDGWAIMDLTAYSLVNGATTYTGLPITGFNAVSDTVSGTERGGVFGNRVTQ